MKGIRLNENWEQKLIEKFSFVSAGIFFHKHFGNQFRLRYQFI